MKNIKINKKSIVFTLKDGGKYKLILATGKIYHEDGTTVKAMFSELENMLYDCDYKLLSDTDIKRIKYLMKY